MPKRSRGPARSAGGRAGGNPPAKTWRGRAQRLAAAIPRSRLNRSVLSWAQRSPAGERWAVAFSGGADSLALLLLAWAHWPERRGGLFAVHFNHRLRGAASGEDARFCARVCRSLGVAFRTGSWARGSKPAGPASESRARQARFAYFERTLAPLRIRALWLGHQQDDVAESILMRLARGSGTGGLAAPRAVQEIGGEGRVHLRPLLDLKKSEIAAALRSSGIAWREDATNARPDYFRNRIRSRVLPQWTRASGRDAVAGAACSRELLEEDDLALELWVDRVRPITPAGRLDLKRLKGCPRAVLRRALYRWLLSGQGGGRSRFGPPGDFGDLSRQGFSALLDAVEGGRPTRQSLGAEGFAVIGGGWLFYARTRG